MWHYLYFIVLIRVKDPTEFTGPESYVHSMIKVCIDSDIVTMVNFIWYYVIMSCCVMVMVFVHSVESHRFTI